MDEAHAKRAITVRKDIDPRTRLSAEKTADIPSKQWRGVSQTKSDKFCLAVKRRANAGGAAKTTECAAVGKSADGSGKILRFI